MTRLIRIAIPLCWMLIPCQGQAPSAKPNFSGSWQIDTAKSNATAKEDIVWKIDHNAGEIVIEEIVAGKPTGTVKCSIAKPCEFDEAGKKMSAMTYFLDTTLVQIRNAGDGSSAVKRQLRLDPDGSLHVDLITIVPADKTESLVFTKQKPVTAVAKQ